jgi:hypothetical protein
MEKHFSKLLKRPAAKMPDAAAASKPVPASPERTATMAIVDFLLLLLLLLHGRMDLHLRSQL